MRHLYLLGYIFSNVVDFFLHLGNKIDFFLHFSNIINSWHMLNSLFNAWNVYPSGAYLRHHFCICLAFWFIYGYIAAYLLSAVDSSLHWYTTSHTSLYGNLGFYAALHWYLYLTCLHAWWWTWWRAWWWA